MAFKKYAYYLKGNKIAVVQMDTTDISAEDYGKYKSPTENVTDGIEIEYTYAPWYRIESTDLSSDTITCTSYYESNGFLAIHGNDSSFSTTASYIVIKDHEKFNGLHEVSSAATTSLTLKTKYTGSAISGISFKVYDHISVMTDEDFEIDITRYQAQAVTYYLKAKMAEDARDTDGREYFLRLFKKQVEKASSSRKAGVHFVQSFWGMRNG